VRRGICRREKRGKLEECGRKVDRRGREEGGKGWERSRGRRRKGIGERGRRRSRGGKGIGEVKEEGERGRGIHGGGFD